MSKKTIDKIIIAIDGPSGVGKSTVSSLVAKKLGLLYVDTGAMYRSVALAAKQSGVDFNNENELIDVCMNLKIEFKNINNCKKVFLNDVDVSKEIRSKEVSELSSIVSQVGEVREFTKTLQRALGGRGGVVMEGRDIGTVIFPHADVKIFLSASNEVRANRRLKDYPNGSQTIESVMKELEERDKRDEQRDIAPLKKADDAHLIDTGGMEVEEVVEKIIKIADNV